MTEKNKSYDYSREAAKITLDKLGSYDEINADTQEEGDRKFAEKTKELWEKFAVSGKYVYNKEKGEKILRAATDLDGNAALGLLRLAGIDTSDLTYVKPGSALEGAINLDTGNKAGVVYEQETETAYFDHHASEAGRNTSTAKIVYTTLVNLGMLKETEALERVVEFVTKIDNRMYPAEEFLKSAKTILGLQRNLTFEMLVEYFKEHKEPTEELTSEEFEKYGLREAAERQQKIVDAAMAKLAEMEKEGKVVESRHGSILINENNELRVGASAAYVRHDGILNATVKENGTVASFMVGLKEKTWDEEVLRNRLGEEYRGKIIRGKMWIYNDPAGTDLTLGDIIDAIR